MRSSGPPFALLVWLVEKEVSGQFLVFVTGEIGLDYQVSLEA